MRRWPGRTRSKWRARSRRGGIRPSPAIHRGKPRRWRKNRSRISGRRARGPCGRRRSRRPWFSMTRCRDRRKRVSTWSAVFPHRWTLLDEGRQPFHGVVGGHQLLEVQPFDFGELPAEPLDEVEPGGVHGEPEGTGASRREVLLEIGEGGMRWVVGQRVHEADPVRFLRSDAAPGEEEIRRAGRTDPLREQAGGRGSEYRQLDLRLSE